MKSGLILAVALPVQAHPTWEEYKQEYGLTFVADEDIKYAASYTSNLAYVDTTNAEPLISFTLGVNRFSHLPLDEFVATFTGELPVAAEEAEVQFVKLESPDLSKVEADYVDWSTDNSVVNPIKDQGSCGSCWAFAATCATETTYALAFNKLYNLADQQLLDCDHNGNDGCDGGLSRFCWEAGGYIPVNGQCQTADYGVGHYTAKEGTCEDQTCMAAIPVGLVVGYVQIALDVTALKLAITERPIKVSVYAESVFQAYKTGVAVCPKCYSGTNHAVVAVGFDGVESFKIRNSWGANWGEGGYIRVAQQPSQKQCKTGDFSLFYRTPVFPQFATSMTV